MSIADPVRLPVIDRVPKIDPVSHVPGPHASPDRVEVSLRYDRDGTRLTVRDRAHRLPAVRAPNGHDVRGYGLTGMRERAELLGGSLSADRTPDGFRVDLWIPA